MKEELPETLNALPIVRRKDRPPALPKKPISPANTTMDEDVLTDEQLEDGSGGVRFARTPDGGIHRGGPGF